MKAFLKYLWIQFKIDVRDKGTLLNYYLVPLAFYFVMGAVFSSVTPLMKSTLAASMTIFAVTLGAIMGSPTALVRMRESGTLRAFKVNGISGTAVLFAQAISTFIHLFIVAGIIYLTTPLAFHGQVPASIPAYFGIVAAYLLASIGIGLFIGVIAPSQAYATMLSMLIFLPSLMLSGIMFPASLLPAALKWTGRIFPATFAMQSFYGLAYHLPAEINATASLLGICTFALIVFVFSFWRINSLSKTEQR